MFDRLPFASGVHIYAAWRGWIQAITILIGISCQLIVK